MKHPGIPLRFKEIIFPGRPVFLLSSLLLAASAVSPAQTAAENLAFFEKQIRPVLVENCYECHSAEARKLKGGLRLDHRAGWVTGGESGPAVTPGKPDESRLLEALRYNNPDLEMPPDGRLPAETVAHFEEWIRRGAPDPREDPAPGFAEEPVETVDLETGRKFWSFQPITDPEPPMIDREGWVRDPIDRFVLAKLTENKLVPSPPATPHTILRRLHNDLTGLPPTLEEIGRFVPDYESDPEGALASKADQLIADPAFGERWGRHWLDLARYSDSSGGGRALPLPDAWRFRDHVIDAFNEDRPLNQIIQEHIAGDLLPHHTQAERNRNLVATGFLVLGPHNYENQDKDLLELEIVDEQLDTIGRSFLGMTIGCARCHDHKFDPVPTRDYYALAGIFTSTTSVRHSNVSSWHTESLALDPAQEAAAGEAAKVVDTLAAQLQDLKESLARLDPQNPASRGPVAVMSLPGIVLDDTAAELTGEWMPSTSVPGFVGAGYIHDKHEEGKKGKSALFRPEIPAAGEYEVRMAYGPGSNRTDKAPVTIGHAKGETTVLLDQRKNPVPGRIFHSLGSFAFARGKEGFIRIDTTGTSGAVIVDAVQLLPTGTPPTPSKPPGETTPEPDQKARIAELKGRIRQLETQLKTARGKMPAPATVMAVRDSNKPSDCKIRLRGMPRNFGEVVPRGFLRVISPEPSQPVIGQGSGRLELAHWLTAPGNPLTARVLANRIWLHLFGHGLVRTPDNFGLTGEAPTHPELLDHLATRLVREGWSTKQLVRAIVLSQSYRLSATPTGSATGQDPGNLLLSHAHRRSVDAETLRDTMLVLGDQLDPRAGGPSLPPGFRSEFGFEFTTLRRSIYVPVFRNSPYDFFSTFDFANPNFTVGLRPNSSTPTQALFLANSPFIHQCAEAAGAKLIGLEASSVPERIRLAFLRTLGRPPSIEELGRSEAFLKDFPPGAEGWISLQRALFSTVDFRYLP